MTPPITLTLTTDQIRRILEAVKRDSDALLVEIEGQHNAQVLGLQAAPAQPDVAAGMASASAPREEEP